MKTKTKINLNKRKNIRTLQHLKNLEKVIIYCCIFYFTHWGGENGSRYRRNIEKNNGSNFQRRFLGLSNLH